MILARWTTGVSILLPLFWLLIFLGALFLRERRIRARTDFVNQLKSCRNELRRGGSVVVDNLVLRYNSPLTTFHLSVGALFFHVSIPSRYRPAYGENQPEAVTHSLCSLLFGWWSVPHGPLRTLHALMFNLQGGERTTVAWLIDRVLLERLSASGLQKPLEGISNTESIPKETAADTGPGSRSQNFLTKRSNPEPGPTLEERIREFYRPTPAGKRFVEIIRKRITSKAEEAKKAVKAATKRRPKKEQSKKNSKDITV